jgi:hypothetical protein
MSRLGVTLGVLMTTMTANKLKAPEAEAPRQVLTLDQIKHKPYNREAIDAAVAKRMRRQEKRRSQAK